MQIMAILAIKSLEMDIIKDLLTDGTLANGALKFGMSTSTIVILVIISMRLKSAREKNEETRKIADTNANRIGIVEDVQIRHTIHIDQNRAEIQYNRAEINVLKDKLNRNNE